jgi:hypothetical protein
MPQNKAGRNPSRVRGDIKSTLVFTRKFRNNCSLLNHSQELASLWLFFHAMSKKILAGEKN